MRNPNQRRRSWRVDMWFSFFVFWVSCVVLACSFCFYGFYLVFYFCGFQSFRCFFTCATLEAERGPRTLVAQP